jgi:hypothetical protein
VPRPCEIKGGGGLRQAKHCAITYALPPSRGLRGACSAIPHKGRRERSSWKTRSTCLTIALIGFLVAAPCSSALAQQKLQVSFKALADNSKITRQQNIEVGDAPNHILRIFEVHRIYLSNSPVINGLKLIEEWNRGTADYIDGNGPVTAQYTVFVMENGDRFFARFAEVVETTATGMVTGTYVGQITGGTGKMAGIRGVVRGVGHIDFNSGFNENKTDIEYSIGN